MESLFQNKIINAAAKFSDQINKLLSENANWYRVQGTALKIKFKGDIQETRRIAIKLHRVENTFNDDLKTFQNALQIASTTAFDLVDASENTNEKSIAEAFG